MAQEREIVSPSMLERTEELQRQIHQLSARDLQLWSIGILVIVVLTAGLVAFLLPNLVWAQHMMQVEQVYLPQLLFGLIVLIVLSNIYLLSQKFSLNETRRSLISQLVLNERLESLSLIDPLTQLMNRRAMNEVIPREVTRANRTGSSLTFMTIDINGFRAINAKYGTMEGNLVLVEFARMMRIVFRGGDVVFRQGGDEFVIVLPETSEADADSPVQRLRRAVAEWNQINHKSYELSYTWGLAAYATGSDFEDVLRALDRKMYQKKFNLTPVF